MFRPKKDVIRLYINLFTFFVKSQDGHLLSTRYLLQHNVVEINCVVNSRQEINQFRETFTVYFWNHLKRADALCDQNAALFAIKVGDTFGNHRAFLDVYYVAHRGNVKCNFMITSPLRLVDIPARWNSVQGPAALDARSHTDKQSWEYQP